MMTTVLTIKSLIFEIFLSGHQNRNWCGRRRFHPPHIVIVVIAPHRTPILSSHRHIMSFAPEKHLIHGGRSTVFAVGTPLEAIFSSFDPPSAANAHLDNTITSPIAVVTSLVGVLFENGSSHARDVNNTSIQRIAVARGVHPDSVRRIASLIFAGWKAGIVPFLIFTSLHVPDASLPLSASSNASTRLCVDFRPRVRYDPLHHIASLECDDEYVCSDATNYIYAPRVQGDATSIRLIITSYGSMYNSAQIKKLRDSMAPVCTLDMAWARSIMALMVGRMTPFLVVKLCAFLAHLRMRLPRSADVLLSMRREGPLIRFALPSSGRINIDTASLDNELDVHREQSRVGYDQSPCIICELLPRTVRCQHCDDLRYCSGDCASADAALHEKTCRVYIRRNAVQGPRAPGGAIVMKAKDE